MSVHVDPQRPDAWKREPFYSGRKGWAKAAVSYRGEVVVYIASRALVIFPDRDVDLGIVGEDEIIVIGERTVAGASRLEAIKISQGRSARAEVCSAAFGAASEEPQPGN